MKTLVPLLARIFLTIIFLTAAYGKIAKFGETQQYMGSIGMPLPALFLVGAIVLLVAGGLSVLLGFKVRWGAVALIVFLVPATLIFHRFWSVPAEQQRMQQIQFMKNLGLIGGLLMLLGYGGGNWTIDSMLGNGGTEASLLPSHLLARGPGTDRDF